MKGLLTLLRQRLFYFIPFLIFQLAGWYVVLVTAPLEPLFFLGRFRAPWLDSFFIEVTALGEPTAYILVFLVLVFVRFRYAIMVPVVGLTTLLTSGLLKTFFSHARPGRVMRDLQLLDQAPLVNGVAPHEGWTSFPSGHTFAAFSIFTFFALVNRSPWLNLLAIFAALLVAVSRLYLMHHFLHDVLFGGVLGVLVALVVYVLQERYLRDRYPALESSLCEKWLARRKKI